MKRIRCLLRYCFILRKPQIQQFHYGKTLLSEKGYLFLYWQAKRGTYISLPQLKRRVYSSRGAVFIPVTEKTDGLTIEVCNTWHKVRLTAEPDIVTMPVEKEPVIEVREAELAVQSLSFLPLVRMPVLKVHDYEVIQPDIRIQQPSLTITSPDFPSAFSL